MTVLKFRTSRITYLENDGHPTFSWHLINPQPTYATKELARLRSESRGKKLVPGRNHAQLTNVFTHSELQRLTNDFTVKLNTDDYLHPGLTWVMNFPDFFISYYGNWISFEVSLDLVSNNATFQSDGTWSLVLDGQQVVRDMESRAAQVEHTATSVVFRTAFFGLLKKFAPKAAISVNLSAAFKQVDELAKTGCGVFLEIIASIVHPLASLDLRVPEWEEEESTSESVADSFELV